MDDLGRQGQGVCPGVGEAQSGSVLVLPDAGVLEDGVLVIGTGTAIAIVAAAAG